MWLFRAQGQHKRRHEDRSGREKQSGAEADITGKKWQGGNGIGDNMCGIWIEEEDEMFKLELVGKKKPVEQSRERNDMM